MIKFLKTIGFSDNIIKLIEDNNTDNQIYSLYCNQDECIKIIDYFKKIGIEIKNIEKLLVFEIDIFFNLSGDIIKSFSKYDLSSVASAINNNYTIVEQLIK